MSEIKLKVEARTVLGLVIVFVGVILILDGSVQAISGVGDITSLIGSEITENRAFLEVLGWFFGLWIEIVGGFFLGIIGTRIIKK